MTVRRLAALLRAALPVAMLAVACSGARDRNPDLAHPPAGADETASAPQITPTELLPEAGAAEMAEAPPLRFTFPTPAPFPVPGWRPPQYPVPLSYRPEDHFWFVRPLAADTVNWPLPVYRYGSTFEGQMSVHAGIDIDAPLGTPVLAAGSGVVVWVGWGLYGTRPVEDDPYGLAIAIRHDFGTSDGQSLYTVYAHLSQAVVWLDQPVRAGEAIGAVGETGNTTGAHLHFEVREGKNSYYSTRNPELWISPPQGWGVLAGRVEDAYGIPVPETEIRIRSAATGQWWSVSSYGDRIAVGDDHYRENFAISDLPAGDYEVHVTPVRRSYTVTVPVHAGQVNFLLLRAGQGFVYEPTPPPRPFPTAPGP